MCRAALLRTATLLFILLIRSALGVRGVKAETLGIEAANFLIKTLKSGACVSATFFLKKKLFFIIIIKFGAICK